VTVNVRSELIEMDRPASDEHSNARDDSETRWTSFSPDEAGHLFEMKALYDIGWFAEDDPYKLPPT